MRYFSTALAAFLCIITKSFSDDRIEHNKLCITTYDCSYPMWECFRDVHGSFGYCRKRKQVSRSANRIIRAVKSDSVAIGPMNTDMLFPRVSWKRRLQPEHQARRVFRGNRKEYINTKEKIKQDKRKTKQKGKELEIKRISYNKPLHGEGKTNRVLQDRLWWKSREGRRKSKEKQRIEIRELRTRKDKFFSESQSQDFPWWKTRSERRKRFKNRHRIRKNKYDEMTQIYDKLKRSSLILKNSRRRPSDLKRPARSAALWSPRGTYNTGLVPVETMERQKLKEDLRNLKKQQTSLNTNSRKENEDNKKLNHLKKLQLSSEDRQILPQRSPDIYHPGNRKSSRISTIKDQEMEKKDQQPALFRPKRQRYFAPGSVMFLNGKLHFVKQESLVIKVPKMYQKYTEFQNTTESQLLTPSTTEPSGSDSVDDLNVNEKLTDPVQLSEQLRKIKKTIEDKKSKKIPKNLSRKWDDFNSLVEDQYIEDHIKSFDKEILNEENSRMNSYIEESDSDEQNYDEKLPKESEITDEYSDTNYKSQVQNNDVEENSFRNQQEKHETSEKGFRVRKKFDKSLRIDLADKPLTLNSGRLRRKVHDKENDNSIDYYSNEEETYLEKKMDNNIPYYNSTTEKATEFNVSVQKRPNTFGISYSGSRRLFPEIYPGWLPPYPKSHLQFGFQPPIKIPALRQEIPTNGIVYDTFNRIGNQIYKRYRNSYNFPRKDWTSSDIQAVNSKRKKKYWNYVIDNGNNQKYSEFSLPFGGSVLGTKLKKYNTLLLPVVAKTILTPLKSENIQRPLSQAKHWLNLENSKSLGDRYSYRLNTNSPSISSNERNPNNSPVSSFAKNLMYLKNNEKRQSNLKSSPKINNYLLGSKFSPNKRDRFQYSINELARINRNLIDIPSNEFRKTSTLNFPIDEQYYRIAPALKRRKELLYFIKKRTLNQPRRIVPVILSSTNLKNEMSENPFQTNFKRQNRLAYGPSFRSLPSNWIMYQNFKRENMGKKKQVPDVYRSDSNRKRYFDNSDQLLKSFYWHPTSKAENKVITNIRQTDSLTKAKRDIFSFRNNPYFNFDYIENADCLLNRFGRRAKNCNSKKVYKKLKKFLKCKSQMMSKKHPLSSGSKECLQVTDNSDLLQQNYQSPIEMQQRQQQIPIESSGQSLQQYPQPSQQQLSPQKTQPDFPPKLQMEPFQSSAQQSSFQMMPPEQQSQINGNQQESQFFPMPSPQNLFDVRMQIPQRQQIPQLPMYQLPDKQIPASPQQYRQFLVQELPGEQLPVLQQRFPQLPVQQLPDKQMSALPQQYPKFPAQQLPDEPIRAMQQPSPQFPIQQMPGEQSPAPNYPQQQILKIDPYILKVQKPGEGNDNLKIQLQWDSAKQQMQQYSQIPPRPSGMESVQSYIGNLQSVQLESNKPEVDKIMKKSVGNSGLVSLLEEMKEKINSRDKSSEVNENDIELQALLSNDLNKQENKYSREETKPRISE